MHVNGAHRYCSALVPPQRLSAEGQHEYEELVVEVTSQRANPGGQLCPVYSVVVCPSRAIVLGAHCTGEWWRKGSVTSNVSDTSHTHFAPTFGGAMDVVVGSCSHQTFQCVCVYICVC